jgi:hypothetical protein
VLDIGGKDAMFMKKKIRYKDEPIEVGPLLDDFLPAPKDLVPKEELIKVTLTLSKSSVTFFKDRAKKHHTKYQRMIRGVVDGYAELYSKYPE